MALNAPDIACAIKSNPRALRPRPRLPKPRNARVHQSRIHFRQRFVAHAEASSDARARVFHQHVRCFHERVQHVTIGGILQIECDATLVAIQREKARTVLAFQTKAHRVSRRIAELGRLDLDDIGAHVAQ